MLTVSRLVLVADVVAESQALHVVLIIDEGKRTKYRLVSHSGKSWSHAGFRRFLLAGLASVVGSDKCVKDVNAPVFV